MGHVCVLVVGDGRRAHLRLRDASKLGRVPRQPQIAPLHAEPDLELQELLFWAPFRIFFYPFFAEEAGNKKIMSGQLTLSIFYPKL